ncbi:MAG: aldehyde dehydrogenase family protein [Bacteroidota bacterium]
MPENTQTLSFEKILEQQRNHFYSYVKNSTARERLQKLSRLRDWITTHEADIAEAIYQDMKKPVEEVEFSETKPVLMEIDHAKKELRNWMRPDFVGSGLLMFGTQGKLIYEPKGVCLILAPWNFPFNLTIGPLVSAIAAGNCCMIKPSEMTPNCSALMQRMVNELFDPNEVQVFLGDHTVATELTRLPFDHIFFTGSPKIGRLVMKAAAENLSSVTLELGGMNPAIVDETADIEDAAEKIAWAKGFNCGQSCMSVNYILVHEDKKSELLDALKRNLSKLWGQKSSSLEDNPDYGRLVNHAHYKRVIHLLDNALEAGAEVVWGGTHNESDHFIAPTVLDEVSDEATVFHEEIFGPLLPIKTYRNIDEVVRWVNDRPKPLAFYVFSNSDRRAEKLIDATSSGTVCVNDTTLPFIHPNLPFGGVNESGIGKAHGKAGFLAFSNERTVVKQRVGVTSAKLVYPPYTEQVKAVIRLIVKWL